MIEKIHDFAVLYGAFLLSQALPETLEEGRAYSTRRNQKQEFIHVVKLNANETWTRAHDLALLLITVGYSSEQDLTDEELDSVFESIARWRPDDTMDEVREIVFEAVAVFQESDIDEEVARSIRSLKTSLSREQRERAMRDVLAVAEADGIIQNNERSLLAVVGDIWDIQETQESMLEESSATPEEKPEWSVLHDITLVYIVLAHGSDGILSEEEIGAILKRLAFWQPELEESDLRDIFRDALQFYSTGPDKDDLTESTDAINEHLTKAQRMSVVNDLVYIGEIDGPLTEYETDMVEQVALLWTVELRSSESNSLD